jgi:archaellum component FlaC
MQYVHGEEQGMDNFMDKISQKLNSQDLIRANSAADAAELENLESQVAVFKEQMEKYDDCMQEMRQLNLKNMESAQDVQNLTSQVAQDVQNLTSQAGEKLEKTLDEMGSASIAGIHQTVEQSLAKIAEIQDNSDKDSLDKMNQAVSGLTEKQDEAFKSLEDFLHTDNVKVYRNVQAAMIEELEKQTNELKETQEKFTKSSRVLLPFVIITMVLSLANVCILVAQILNLL